MISVRDGSLFPTAAVRAERKSLEASYEVRAEVGPGIHATFGSLGQLDVSFERRRKEIDRPEKGCRWIFESGVFRGSFRFVGEGGYVSSEATDPAGEVLRLPNGFCGLGDFRRARPFFDLRQTVLAAKSKVGDVSFTASRFAGDRTTFFTALLRERADGMEILRRASARGREGTFFNTRASRASVLPPGPFDGSARFRDPADGPRSWIGSLSVSLPGAEEVALAGDAFAAKLCPRLSIFESCLRRPPRHASAAAASAYGSGSHSQPLALARLSSLR
ncbi:MAG TPA: hypothetical protein VFS26_06600 [Solirubrobacterales bacterium]|nr:hypothetical protein [Solirubrobacterales bacterium]